MCSQLLVVNVPLVTRALTGAFHACVGSTFDAEGGRKQGSSCLARDSLSEVFVVPGEGRASQTHKAPLTPHPPP